jgi:copper chaperone CopZ
LVPGAALVFLIAGTATNVVTIAFVGQKFGKKVIVIYLISIVILALVFGLVLDSLVSGVTAKEMLFKGRDLPFVIQLLAVVLFLGLVARSLLKGKGETMQEARFTFTVPDMNCKHCQATVTKALNEVPGITNVEIALDERLVRVNGDVDRETVEKKIKEAGFNPAECGPTTCSM